MAGRDVTLTIKVNDREVTTATASLNRLDRAANDVGRTPITQKVDTKPLREVEAAQNAVTKSSNAMAAGGAAGAGGLARMTAAAGPAGLAIAAVAIVVAGLTAGIVALSKHFADHAIEVGNVAEANGLAVGTMSALRHEAEAQGRSIQNLDGMIGNFRKTIGEAAAGSDEAREKLKLLGFEGNTSIKSLDDAFRVAVATIAGAPTPVEQVKRAIAAFGDEGYRIIPFLREFGGDIDKLIAKAEELGINLGGQQVTQAREFQRAYADVRAAVQGVMYAFGSELLPVARDLFLSLGNWLKENKGSVREWAESTGKWVVYIVEKLKEFKQWVDDNPHVINLMKYGLAVGTVKSAIGAMTGGDLPPSPQGSPLPTAGQDFGLTPSTGVPDPGAIAAMLEKQKEIAEKLRKEREASAKAELAAQIQLYENSASRLGSAYDDAFRAITEKFKETLDITQYQAAFEKLDQWYADQQNELIPKWEELVKQQTLASNKGANEQWLVKQDLEAKKDALRKRSTDNEAAAEKAIADVRKKQSAEAIRAAEAQADHIDSINQAKTQRQIAMVEGLAEMEKITAVESATRRGEIELKFLDQKKKDRQTLLDFVKGNGEKETEVKRQIALVDEEIANQQVTNSNRVNAAKKKEQEAIDKLRESYEEYKLSLEDEITILARGGKELTTYEKVLRDMERDYKELDAAQKNDLLNKAAQIDALKELNRQHAELKEFFKDSLRYVFEGNFEGLFESWGDRIKDKFADVLGGIFATSVLGFNPNDTNNPVAKPIVNTLETTNDLLRQVVMNTGGGAVGAGMGGGGLGSIFGRIFGGGGAGGQGPGGTPNWNPGASGGGGRSNPMAEFLLTGGISGDEEGGFSGGGGVLGNLRRLFSTQEGGLFEPINGSRTAGIMSGIGTLATIAGSMIGGRAGRVIGMAGTGMSIGAMFGGPIGAGIGAAIGALIGLFGGGGTRRQDEATRNQGMIDAQAAIRKGFDDLITQVRFGTIEPSQAIIQGGTIGDNVRNQYLQMANSLRDSKARRHALADVSRIDGLIAQKMAELRGVVEMAQGSADRMKRILPEFAGGVFISDAFRSFQRYNGLIPGSWSGRDYRAALLADAEMVLNPSQQARVRAAAGFDAFAYAGIPNYPNANNSTGLAAGGIAGSGGGFQVNVQPHFTLVAEGVTFEERARVWVESDDGGRTLATVIKKKQKDGDF